MTDALVAWLTEFLSNKVSNELIAIIVSMFPIIELRGGIPVAYLLGLDWFPSYILCVIGNLIPVPFILWFITPIFNWLKKTKLFSGWVNKLEKKSMAKSGQITKYEAWGLFLFVAIPLPGTGAWTGSLIASLLNMPFKKAFVSILCGVLTAGFIMTVLSFGLLDAVIGLFS